MLTPSSGCPGVAPAQSDERRDQVDERDRGVVDRAGLETRAADHERYVEDLVEQVVLGRQPVLAERVTVVGGEDDVGVVELAQPVELRHRRRHRVVHRPERPHPRAEQRLHPGPAGLRIRRPRGRSPTRCSLNEGESNDGGRTRAAGVVVLALPPRQVRTVQRDVRRHVVDDREERRPAVGEPVEGVARPLGHGLGDVLVADPVAVEEARPLVGVDATHLGVPEGPPGRLAPGSQPLVAVEELAVVRRSVARRLQATGRRCRPGSRSRLTPPQRPVLCRTPLFWPYCPVTSSARAGQHIGCGEIALEKRTPGRTSSRRVFGHEAELVGPHVVGEDEDDVGCAPGAGCSTGLDSLGSRTPTSVLVARATSTRRTATTTPRAPTCKK